MKKSKNPLTVYEELGVPAQFDNKQLIHLLQSTPRDHVYKRPAKGGGEWEYVTGVYVKKVLNYTFGFLWSSEIREMEEKYGQISATVRLTIHKPDGSVLIWKEDIGKKDVIMKKGTSIPLDYGNDKKAAVTDGLKRCAAQFGIASDVYGKEEFKEIALEKVPEDKAENKPLTDAQKTNIKKLIDYDEMTVDDKDFADEWINQMSFTEAAAKIQELMMTPKKAKKEASE